MITTQSLLACSSLFIVLLHFSQTSHAFPQMSRRCSPSSCGLISNIISPFRLKNDPKHCGHREFELACENNVTSIYLGSHKYYVKAINYSNSTIRLVDASINIDDTCSFPNYSAYAYNFTNAFAPDGYPYFIKNYTGNPYVDLAWPINFMSCPRPLKNSSLFTDITDCASNSSQARYTYIKVGHMNASDMIHMCELDLIVVTSWNFLDWNNVSLSEIHRSLLYGFELTICEECILLTKYEKYLIILGNSHRNLVILLVIVVLLSAGVGLPVAIIIVFTGVLGLILYIALPLYFSFTVDILLIGGIILPRFVIVCPSLAWFFIYKFRRRHMSIFEVIECFLRSDNKLVPIKYSYVDIKKMTGGFREKIGEGGYGSVYRGKLRSGQDVAVKLLGKSGTNGQDFINEIATIGRIHHVNIIKLVGYCAEGSKRALVFDFMLNGSLEKYIFSQEKKNSLNWDTKFQIAVGVARGIKYLHQECDVQILHFDIKPHNILLDDNFIPKISDFGLSKYFSREMNTVTLTAARGTIDYVAPELINRGIGRVSYKADVYSFGMLLIEMLSLKRDLIGTDGDSSQYFPNWIYDCINQGKNIQIGKTNEIDDDNDSGRKFVQKMTKVALWCIQMSPDDRPSMNKVLEMLEGDVDHVQIPIYPSQSTENIVNVDQTDITCSTDSISLLHHDHESPSIEICVQELHSLP